MWPVLLDMTKEESMQSLRNLELEAYAHLVSALRAQGPLNSDKRKFLKDSSHVLNIPPDRHKAEIRRAVNDEKLNTIAYHVTGLTESVDDWAQEGRRAIPLIPRLAPQTAYSAIADEAAESANHNNKQLPLPALTERKRPPPVPIVPLVAETSKGAAFRVPETPKGDDAKKRKLPVCTESSSLAQHLLSSPKVTRAQQIYRQRLRTAFMKEPSKSKQVKAPFTPLPQSSNGAKTSPPQPQAVPSSGEETIEQIQNEVNSFISMKSELANSNENQAPTRPKVLTPIRSSPNLTFKQITTSVMASGDKTVKVCPKKTVCKPGTPLGQKLIVVSNAQTIPSSSILHKTLSIPLVKNISVKNLDKFKIVTSATPQIANNLSLKHKVVTVKTSQAKKVIPLSLLNSKGGIKVLPIGGKIVGKTTTTTASPLYIVNTLPKVSQVVSAENSISQENGKSSVLGDIMKASGMTTDDFDAQIEEFKIPNHHVNDAQERVEGESDKDFTLEDEVNNGNEIEIVGEKCDDLNEPLISEKEVTVDSETVILEDLTGVCEAAGN